MLTPLKTNRSPKKGTILVGNTSEPNIDFQGTFVRFRGSKQTGFDICLLQPLELILLVDAISLVQTCAKFHDLKNGNMSKIIKEFRYFVANFLISKQHDFINTLFYL